MIGKFLLPVAIGGGLLLLLSSSAKAESAPRNPFDALPSNLRILAAQAQGTNDPAMLDITAGQLEMQGFVQAAGVLRMQAEQMRRIRAGTAPPPAAAIVASTPSSPAAPAQPAFGPTGPPFVPAPDPPRAAPRLSPDVQNMVAEAIQNGTVPVLTSTAFVIERAGFPEIAEDLRRRAREAAAKAPLPQQRELPNAALDPSMPSELALEVARQLQLQGDPAALEALARELRLRGFNKTADQVEAKAKQIRAMLDAARTMRDIDAEFKSPGIPQPPGRGAPPVQELPPVTVTATPPIPLPVPATPLPQPQPSERSKAQILADALSTSLNNLIDQAGSVPKARFKEDQGLVQRFQTEQRLTADGKYGPTTAEHVARFVSDVPPPFYWKRGAGQKDLGRYRSNIESIALDAEQLGNLDRAARLRASSAKASLA